MKMHATLAGSSGFTTARRGIALLSLVALGLLSLGTSTAQAQAYAACTDGVTLAGPFFWIPGTGAGFSHSTGTTAAPGAPTQNGCFFHTGSTMTPGNGYGLTLADGTAMGDGSSVVYLVEVSQPSVNIGTDNLVSVVSTNGAIGMYPGMGTATNCISFQAAKSSGIWGAVCYLTNNAGVTKPEIEFHWVSGVNNRFDADVVRFTLLACLAKPNISGPYATNATSFTVTGVFPGATNINVYQNNGGVVTKVGSLTSGVVAGNNTVPVSGLALGAQVIATQVITNNESCVTWPGPVLGGGANPRIRLSLDLRTSPNNLNAGPVGAASDSTGSPGLFFMPGIAGSTLNAPGGGLLVYPSNNWQTITFDPRTAVKGNLWSGTRAGSAVSAADHVDSWASLESLVLQMDDTTDVGPFVIYLDNIYSGQVLLTNFDRDAPGSVEFFLHPSYSGYPVGQFEGPDSAMVTNSYATSGTNAGRIQFEFSGGTTANWVRLLANGGGSAYPQIDMTRPFQFDLLLLPRNQTSGHAVGSAPPLPDQATGVGQSATFTVSVTAPGDPANYGQLLPRAYTYQWQKDGVDISGATASGFTTNAESTASAGTYAVVVGDGTSSLTRQAYLTVTNMSLAVALTWTNPVQIAYGTPLGDTQFNALATYSGTNVPGAFTYIPGTNAILNAGTNTLAVLFSPSDTNTFGSATTNVTLVVTPALLTITASNASKAYGQTLTFAGTEFAASGLLNGDAVTNVTLTSAGAAASALPDAYLILPSSALGRGVNNYAITDQNGTLTVSGAGPQIASQPSSLVVQTGAKASFFAAATGTPPLSYQWLSNGTPLIDGGRITGSLTTNLTVASTVLSDAGSYQIIVTNAYGAITSSPAILTVTTSRLVFWTNTAGGNWSTPANWSTGTVPSIHDNVFISSNGTYTVTMDISPVASSVTFGNNAGTLTLSSSSQTLTVSNSIQVLPQANVIFDGPTFVGGVFTNAGTLSLGGYNATFNNPVVTMPASFTRLNGSPAYQDVIFNSGFTNNGIFEVDSGRFTVNNGPMVNAPGGVLNMLNGAANNSTFGLINQGIFNVQSSIQGLGINLMGTNLNSGTINLQGGSVGFWIRSGATVWTNTGSINLTNCSVSLAMGSSSVFTTTGSIFVDTNSSLAFNYGGMVNYPSGSISGGGTVVLDTVTANWAPDIYTDQLHVSVVEGATLSGAGGIYNPVGQTLLVAGTVNKVLTNAGALTLQQYATFNAPVITTPSSFIRQTLNGFGPQVVFNGGFTNNGVYQVESGRLSVNNGPLVNAPGATVNFLGGAGNGGTFELVNQGTFNVQSSSQGLGINIVGFNLNSGTINCQGGSMGFWLWPAAAFWTNTGSLNLSNCSVSFAMAASSAFATTGSIFVDPNSSLAFNYGGSVTLGPQSSLTLGIGGRSAGAGYGQITAYGSMQLGGAVNLVQTNGFIPTVGDSFRILNWGARRGGFSAANGLSLGNGLYFQGVADRSGLSLVAKTSLVPAPPPATNLVNQTVAFGDTAVFSFAPPGVEPFTYQWAFSGTNLPGQTGAMLVLTNVQAANLGTYCMSVVDALNVSNTYCATLSAITAAGIGSQPGGQTTTNGANITLTVTGTGGAPLRYQWRLNGANIAGATNSTYTITNAQPRDGGMYSVLVANPVRVISSSNAKVKVGTNTLAFADNFIARGTITNFSGIGGGSNTNATHEPGEPNHDGKPGTHSVWLQWKAPADGVATFNTRGSSCDTLLGIYTGTSLTNLTSVAGDDDRGDYFTSEAVLSVTNGVAYQLAVDGLASASGDLVLTWNLDTNITQIPKIIQQPGAVTVAPGGVATFSVFAASTSSLTYQWYLGDWLAIPGATNAVLTVSNVSYLNVGIYSVEVTSAAGQTVESLTASLEIGPSADTHSFDKLEDLLQAIQSGGSGSLAQPPKKGAGTTPQNMSFPSVAAGTIGSQIINNFNSTTEQGEPIHADVIGGSSRWYLLTAADNGTIVIDTLGSDIVTVLSVYTGGDIFSLQLVASDRNSAPDGVRSLVKLNARSGTNYLIAVDGMNGAQGNINLNWRLGTPPNGSGPAQSRVVAEGASLVLLAGISNNVTAPFYQWRRNGVSIVGATNASFSLASIQFNQVGVYSVVVSNLVGQVNNSIATVSVESPLRLGRDTGGFRVSGSATQAVVLQLSTNLTLWTPLYTNPTPLLPVSFLDTNSAARPEGFYQLKPWP